MPAAVRLAFAGVGNNISALMQGIYYYSALAAEGVAENEFPGIRRPRIGGLGVQDIAVVAAYDVQPQKVGLDVAAAIFEPPNNYPRLGVELPTGPVIVQEGITGVASMTDEISRVAKSLQDTGAEVLLYSLPTGLQWAATAYAEAALAARVAFVNCTPEIVARDQKLRDRYIAADVPLIGDDLASHFGTSILHRAVLALFVDRGITLTKSYQVNLGGNEDFRNLRERGSSKRDSKLNALAQEGVSIDRVTVIPSAGFVPQLLDEKVAFVNIEGAGWASTTVRADIKLQVQDSSNAAGVVIDLVRIAAAALRNDHKGFVPAAVPLLKSPPWGHAAYAAEEIAASFDALARGPEA